MANNRVPKLRLESWKSIAEYLHRSPRTVQRWHADHGLPVHHFGKGKGPVFAYSGELDTWLSGFAEGTSVELADSDDALDARQARSSELAAIAGEMWELRTEENLNTIAGLYRKAIDQYPGNAAAFIGLANSIILATLAGIMPSSAAYPRASKAVQRALQLDSDSIDARCAAAWLQMVHERKWNHARDGFDAVLNQQPRCSLALSGRALLHIAEGNVADASHCLHEAWKQNTLASTVYAMLCWMQYLAGDYEQALATVAHAGASGDSGALIRVVEALALIQDGSVAMHIQRLERMAIEFPRNLVLQGALGYAYAVTDRTGKAWEIFYNLKRRQGDNAYPLALILIGLDEKVQALLWLETSFSEGSLWSLGFRFDPFLRTLRDRHHDLFQHKMHFPSAPAA